MKQLALVLFVITAAAAQADLKTWLHGAPPAPTPGPPDPKAAAVSFAPNVVADKQILEFLKTFAEGLRIHDGKALKPMLSEAYEIDGLPEEHDPVEFFMQAMMKVKAPDEIVITAIEREGETRSAKMEFRSSEREAKERTFRFDANGKLLSADFFTLKHR